MSANDRMLEAYRGELSYLRRMGARFARDHPKVAARLSLSPEQVVDPHVERLLESFAFLTARVRQDFEDELPEVTAHLLGLLAPHLVQPVPSCSIAHFEVDPKQKPPPAGLHLERHTRLYAETGEGHQCSFRTAYPVTLWPLVVEAVTQESTSRHAFLDSRSDVVTVLRVRLKAQGAAFSKMDLARLPLHLGDERDSAHSLFELLACNLLGVVLVPDPDEKKKGPIHLSADALRFMGFEREEALLPAHPNTHAGHRLLQEFFAFPEKFHFVELDLGRQNVQAAEHVLDILFLLDRTPPARLKLTRNALRTGCTPIVNLFPKVSEPIRLDHRRTEYPLVPDHHRERTLEIHSIVSVSASTLETDRARRVDPFFSYRHPVGEASPVACWSARRQATGRADLPGTELYLSFLDLDFHPSQPAHQVLFAHTLCTNRRLAEQLREGDRLQMEEGAALRGISLLRAPTPQLDPPLGGSSLWRLVSMLSLNHLSLTQGKDALAALQEILRLHDFTEHGSGEPLTRGLTGLSCREAVARLPWAGWRGFCRGQEVTLEFDEDLYQGSSAVLLGAVLSHFLGLYAAVNSFTRLVMKRKGEASNKVWKRWPARAGEQIVP
ncbi:type VI secretion system baseplate subunit TssF [Corallococcus sp. BB11-1]|uniref:type VI secretion system baseplate subunit TssF n=1 Tax=Corallococcus sp. BB11-1 TaxID=2996783 RepID=UPI002271CCE2|nr:type VI secretion system baseplate subunit TssF [Corallococcus sp. BB11-1]MCY1033884.1 type VI secretion system baseplate subunit TssF [Corallococcus sp. BB11-1]